VDEGQFVVDASPLILLAAIDGLSLLAGLAGEVVIPRAVLDEVLAGKDPHPSLRELVAAPWARVEPSGSPPPEVAGWDLGAGESQVLTLALARSGSEAVLDDLQARRCARSLSIPVTGTLGIILRAKRRRLVPAARPLVEGLREHRIYLAHDLLEAALAEVGE
jgi:predicted nucleic acid-binding protein